MEQFGQYNATPVLRDVQVAQEIRSMAALGKFPKEVIVYGLVYFKNNQRQYMISTEPAKLISFLNCTENLEFFPTPIESYSERLLIPEGYEADIVKAIKLKLARKLQTLYPYETFVILQELNTTQSNDVLNETFLQYRGLFESEFSVEKIKAFSALCTKAYLRKNISTLVYQQINTWCEKRLLQLENYIPPGSSKERTFYGMAILENYKIQRCVMNANLNCIYQEKQDLEKQGFLTTIWHKQKFQVELQGSLQGVVAQMTEILVHIYDESMTALLKQIEQAPGVISSERFTEAMTQLHSLGEGAEQLGKMYGRLWGKQK